MFAHPRLRRLLDKFEDMIYYAELQMGAFNYEVPKDTVLIGTAPHIQHLGRRMTRQERDWMRSDDDRIHTADHSSQGSRGNSNLKPTQAYPAGFGAAHALAYQNLNLYDLGEHMEGGLELDFDDEEDVGLDLSDSEPDPYLEDLYSENPDYWDRSED